jgi:signal transduction histidine kinase
VLEVEDNGKGIDESAMLNPKSLGILGMRERALPFGGGIEITAVPNQGTRVRVSIPLALKETLAVDVQRGARPSRS